MTPDDKTPLSESHLLTIYEARNETRSELYVGSTALLPGELAKRFFKKMPHAVAHWSAGDKIVVKSLAYAVPKRDAAAAIARVAAQTPPRGWRVLASL